MGNRMELSTGQFFSLSQAEIDRRHALLSVFLEKEELDLLMIVEPDRGGYRKWLTGVDGTERRSESCLLFSTQERVLHFIGNTYLKEEAQFTAEEAAQPGIGPDFEGIRTVSFLAADQLLRFMHKENPRRMGIVHSDAMRVSMWNFLKNSFPDLEWIDVEKEIRRYKGIKSDEERKLIASAVELTEKTAAGMLAFKNDGISEPELVRYGRYLANHLGSGGIDNMLHIQIELKSWNASDTEFKPIPYPGRRIGKEDSMRLGLRIQGDSGYIGSADRVQTQNPELQKRIRYLAELLEEGTARIEAGMTVREARACFCEDAGIRFSLSGVGTSLTEYPAYEEEGLDRDTVIYAACEEKDFPGLKIGNTYRMTENGLERLNRLPYEL